MEICRIIPSAVVGGNYPNRLLVTVTDSRNDLDDIVTYRFNGFVVSSVNGKVSAGNFDRTQYVLHVTPDKTATVDIATRERLVLNTAGLRYKKGGEMIVREIGPTTKEAQRGRWMMENGQAVFEVIKEPRSIEIVDKSGGQEKVLAMVKHQFVDLTFRPSVEIDLESEM